MLRPGDKGPEVLALQQRLSDLGYWLGTPDGSFGNQTLQAVYALQKAAGIGRDGEVGPAPKRALANKVRPRSVNGGNGVEIDLDRQLLLIVRDGSVRTILNTSTGNGQPYISSYGTNAVLLNPSNMGFSGTFAIEPLYQLQIASRTSGVGVVVMDSLNNERIALGLGYIATVGGPKVSYTDVNGDKQNLELVHTGHEVGMPISINAVLGWLAFGIRPKFQFSALRFRDLEGTRQDARKEQTAFGLDVAMSFSFRQYATVSVIGQNLAGPAPSTATLNLAPLVITPMTLDRSRVSPVSDYPRTVSHALAVFPTRYSFVSEGGNQTTLVASAQPQRLGPYAIRGNARLAQPTFDFDLQGLAARLYLRRDWDSAEVLRDDFDRAELKAATERHNETCVKGCRYGL